ncbi:MAG: DnaD domain protein [Lachnospiraceae bacterium]|nr:DnaD domain protein [Lachnospiraceae bacterium]
MDTITITTRNHETYSAVSNFFIDYYMTEANGEFVKVYLYLVRLLNSGRAFTIADIADHFNLTEKDICRAIRYWIKQDVIQLEYTDNRHLTGITMLPLTARRSHSDDASLLSMLGVTDDADRQQTASDNASQKAVSSANNTPSGTMAQPAAASAVSLREDNIESLKPVIIPKKVSYKASFIDKKKEDEDFGNLLYQTEIYFGKPLTQTDVNTLLYIYEELSFHPDLLEYLVEYCVTIGKKSSRYIEAVALEWYKNGIQTVEEAKIASKNYNSIYVAVLKQLGIPRRVPTPTETTFIDTWYNTYSFNKSIIIEACKRAITTNPHSANFNYVNGILEKWHQQNVRKLSDIEELDRKWAEEKKKKAVSKKTTSDNQFNHYEGSTNRDVVNEFETLFLQETNQ